jgi:hypothetical protein
MPGFRSGRTQLSASCEAEAMSSTTTAEREIPAAGQSFSVTLRLRQALQLPT